jgi:hypothetical protein
MVPPTLSGLERYTNMCEIGMASKQEDGTALRSE